MKILSIVLLSVSLTVNISYSQTIDIKNYRAVIQNLGVQISELDIKIDTSKIKELGFENIDDLNLPNSKKQTHITNISDFSPHVSGKFYNFQYDEIFIIQSKNSADLKTLNINPNQNLELYYTIRAIEILKIRYADLYQKLVLSVVNPSVQSTEQNNFTSWYNRYVKIIISFNTGSNDIAISGTYLDPLAINFSLSGQSMNFYENFSIISINSEIIKGTNKNYGSYPIYKKDVSQENYLLYLREGLLQSICYELIHRYIDNNNVKKQSIFNYIYFGNGRKNTNNIEYDRNLYNIEEVIVNRTLDKYFTKSGGLSFDLLNYYLKVEQNLLNSVSNLDIYKKTLLTKTFLNQDLSLDL